MATTQSDPRDGSEESKPMMNQRAIVVFVSLCLLYVVVFVLAIIMVLNDHPFYFVMAFLPFIPFVLYLNRQILCIVACGWKKRFLSNHVRAPVPRDFYDWSEERTFIRVGGMNVSWPLARWRCGPQGISLKIFLLGEFYLPMECIVSVRMTSHWNWRCRIVHASPDIKSPILTSGVVHRLISSCLPECAEAD